MRKILKKHLKKDWVGHFLGIFDSFAYSKLKPNNLSLSTTTSVELSYAVLLVQYALGNTFRGAGKCQKLMGTKFQIHK